MEKWINRIANEIQEILEYNMDFEDALPQYTIENDGIGYYEYWGATGYDEGRNYVLLAQKHTELKVNIEMFISERLFDKIYWKLYDFVESYNGYEKDGVIFYFRLYDFDYENGKIIIGFEWIENKCKVDENHYDECIDF